MRSKGRVLVVCASDCNRRGMEDAGVRRLAEPVFHDYDDRLHRALLHGPSWAREQERRDPGLFDLERLVDEVVELGRRESVDGVVVTQDYPGALAASFAARRLGLPGPAPAAVVACQHKYLSRLLQRRLVPAATPPFARLAPLPPEAAAADPLRGQPPLPLPAFAKPVRANYSFGAGRVDTETELAAGRRLCALPEAYLRPLAQALERTAGEPPLAGALGDLVPGGDDGTGDLLLERLLTGDQVTLEGIAAGGEVLPLAVVDSHFLPGTLSFASFRYPSRLPAAAQDAAWDVVRRLVRGIGFDGGLFNVEMIWDREAGRPWILEINPRMCSQWADLLGTVDGVNTYEHAVRVALGLPVEVRRGAGRHAVGASFPLRSREDLRAESVPTAAELRAAEARVGGIEAYVYAASGRRLSELEQVQDGYSWCYGRVNAAAADEAELEAKLARFLAEIPLRFAAGDGDQYFIARPIVKPSTRSKTGGTAPFS